MSVAGGCHCGAVRYVLALDAAPAMYCCHCLTCQTWSGSAFSENALLPESAIGVTGPLVDTEKERTSSGPARGDMPDLVPWLNRRQSRDRGMTEGG